MTMELTGQFQREIKPNLTIDDQESYPYEEPEENPNVIQSENLAELTSDQIIENATVVELDSFEQWMAFRVKNELVKQIFEADGHSVSDINYDKVYSVVAKELEAEKDKKLKEALQLNSALMLAAVRSYKDPHGFHDYGPNDLEAVQRRIDIKRNIITSIKATEATGYNGIMDKTIAYVNEVELKARKEVLDILKQQKQGLEQRITELEDELIDRNMELLDIDVENDIDEDLIGRLSQEAQALAR